MAARALQQLDAPHPGAHLSKELRTSQQVQETGPVLQGEAAGPPGPAEETD